MEGYIMNKSMLKSIELLQKTSEADVPEVVGFSLNPEMENAVCSACGACGGGGGRAYKVAANSLLETMGR